MEIKTLDQRMASQFRTNRTRQIMVSVPLVLVFIIIIWLGDNPQSNFFGLPNNIVFVIGFAAVVGALIFSFINWRCHSCEKYLGKSINPKFCSKCGVQLR
ncbi:MAG: hypothetical protein ACE5HS_17110 [bacterium]